MMEKKIFLFVLLVVVAGAVFSAEPAGGKIGEPAGLDQSGRSIFLTGTTIFGFGYWGLSLPEVLGVEDSGRMVGIYMLTGGAGFFIPYFLTQESRLTKGMAVFSLSGGVKGNLDGALVYYLLRGDKAADRGLYAATLTGSITELFTLYKIAEKKDYSLGKANLLASVSTFGYLYGFLSYATISDAIDERGSAAFMLGGGILGYLAGSSLFRPETYGDGDYVMPTLSATLAGLFPVCMMTVMDKAPENRAVAGLSLAASALGMWVGDRLVRDINMSTSQGNYISLGTFGGALVALGLVFAIGGDTDSTYRWLPLLSVAGGTGGMALVYSTFKKHITAKKDTALRLEVNPAALVLGFRERTSGIADMITVLPAFSASYVF